MINAYENWMVQSNLKSIADGEDVETVVSTLRRNGYGKVADEVEKAASPKFDLVGSIMDYEEGNLNDEEVLDLFARLIKDGTAWSLQGSYGRQAAGFIDSGFISPEGEVTQKAKDFLETYTN